MRRPSLLLLAAFCAATTGCGGLMGGEAACAGHAARVEASPSRAAHGQTFSLHGEGFYGDFVCDDTGPSFLSRPTGGRPTDGIRIELSQGAKTWTLATASSDENLTFDSDGLKVPPDAAPGEALVRATSPTVHGGERPPRAETPFRVLDRP